MTNYPVTTERIEQEILKEPFPDNIQEEQFSPKPRHFHPIFDQIGYIPYHSEFFYRS